VEKKSRGFQTPLTVLAVVLLVLALVTWRLSAGVIPVARAEGSVGIPILMYHKINPDPETGNLGLRVPPSEFDWQMQYLFSQGYHSVSLQEVKDYIKEGKPLPPKPVAITFDDGYRDNYTYALPVLEKVGYTATVFVVVNTIGKVNRFDLGVQPVNQMMNWSELRDMASRGIAIGSHTMDHPHLSEVAPEKALYQIRESKSALEKGLGQPVKYFCYPYGSYNQIVKKAVEECGYEAATTTHQGLAYPSDDVFALRRVYVTGQMSHQKFIREITRTKHVTENVIAAYKVDGGGYPAVYLLSKLF